MKVKLWAGLMFLAVLLECVGVYKLVKSLLTGNDAGRAPYFVLAGLVLGLPSAVMWHYSRASVDRSLDQDKVAVETLAKLGERKKINKVG